MQDVLALVVGLVILSLVAVVALAARRQDKRKRAELAFQAREALARQLGMDIRRPGFGPPPPAYTWGQRRTWGGA